MIEARGAVQTAAIPPAVVHRGSLAPPWLVFAIAGLAASGVYFMLPPGLPQNVLYQVIGLASVVAIMSGVALHRPAARSTWILVAVGQLLWTAADMAFLIADERAIELPYPSIADAIYLLGYPIIAVGIYVMSRQRSRAKGTGHVIDATILSMGLGILAWLFLVQPSGADQSLGLAERLTSMAYPLMDVLLLAIVVRLVLGSGQRSPASMLFSCGLVALVVGDVVYGTLSLQGAYTNGDPVDLAWTVSYILIGAAALHPSMRELTSEEGSRSSRPSRGRLVALAGAALLVPAAFGLQYSLQGTVNVPLMVGSGAILFLLVVLRMAGLVHQLEGAEQEREGLLDRTLRATEEERVRIAAELHDGPIQHLAAVGMGLQRAQIVFARGEAEVAGRYLDDVHRGISEEIDSLRGLMSELRPPALDYKGVEDALRDLARDVDRRGGITCTVRAGLKERLSTELETVVYRVAQEALTNVVKHARASTAAVTLESSEGQTVLTVHDDGDGFDPARSHEFMAAGHFGLMAMRERVKLAGGEWSLWSSPGHGTLIRAALPSGEAR